MTDETPSKSVPDCPFCYGTNTEELAEGYYNCPDCDTEFDLDEETP